MNAEQLKAKQVPLKEKYKADAGAALITLRAEARTLDDVACRIETGKGRVEAGLHPATGGDGSQACAGDMLLEALVACAGTTLRAVSTGLGIELKGARITAEGDMDFRGTLGVSKEAPVGFKDIRLRFDLDTGATEEQQATLIRLTERYCVVLQTLRRAHEVAVSTHQTGA